REGAVGRAVEGDRQDVPSRRRGAEQELLEVRDAQTGRGVGELQSEVAVAERGRRASQDVRRARPDEQLVLTELVVAWSAEIERDDVDQRVRGVETDGDDDAAVLERPL